MQWNNLCLNKLATKFVCDRLHFWLIYQTIFILTFCVPWSRHFWWGYFSPRRLLRPGTTASISAPPPLTPPVEPTGQCGLCRVGQPAVTEPNGRAPPYLSQHCMPVSSADTRRHLRSANRHLLAVPRFRLNTPSGVLSCWTDGPELSVGFYPTSSTDCFRRLL